MTYDRKLPTDSMIDVKLIEELAEIRMQMMFWCLACWCRFARNLSAMEEAGVTLPKHLCEECAKSPDSQLVLERATAFFREKLRLALTLSPDSDRGSDSEA